MARLISFLAIPLALFVIPRSICNCFTPTANPNTSNRQDECVFHAEMQCTG